MAGSPEGQLPKIALLQIDQQLLVLGSKPVENRRMHDDPKLEIGFIAGAFLENLAQLSLDLDAHRQGTLHLASAFAVHAIMIDGRPNTLRVALPGHFHEAKLGNGQNVGLGPIAAQSFFDPLIHGLLVAPRFHVNSIAHNQLPPVSESKLPANLFRRFQADFHDGRFLGSLPAFLWRPVLTSMATSASVSSITHSRRSSDALAGRTPPNWRRC